MKLDRRFFLRGSCQGALAVMILVAGGAGGRVKTGYHIAGDNSPVSRVGLTLQKALGVSVDNWGKESLQVRTPYTELLA